MIWGHGLRPRQVRGPPQPAEPPQTSTIVARRYLCRACKAVLLVVPRGIARCKHYAATAIAFALALFGVDKRPMAEIREALSERRTIEEEARWNWPTLRRWIDAVGRAALWPSLPRSASPSSARLIAERAAMALASHARLSLAGAPLSHRAFHGGEHMA